MVVSGLKTNLGLLNMGIHDYHLRCCLCIQVLQLFCCWMSFLEIRTFSMFVVHATIVFTFPLVFTLRSTAPIPGYIHRGGIEEGKVSRSFGSSIASDLKWRLDNEQIMSI